MTEALSSYRIDSERAASAPFARAFPLVSVDHARNREAEMRLMARMVNAARERDSRRAYLYRAVAANSAALPAVWTMQMPVLGGASNEAERGLAIRAKAMADLEAYFIQRWAVAFDQMLTNAVGLSGPVNLGRRS